MIVNHAYRFIFIKTKKTGSTSTERWLVHYGSAENSVRSVHATGRGEPTRNHSSAREIHAFVGDEMWRRYMVIANVRNPWDKMVSLLFFRPGRTRRFGSGSLEIVDQADARRRLEGMTTHFTRSPCDTFLDPDSPQVDRVIRLDRLESDLRMIAADLTLPDRDRPLTRDKSRTRPEWARDWRPLYTDAAIEAVATRYADWIDAYGYTFESREATR